MKLSFEELKRELLQFESDSVYKQAAIVMLREIFTKRQQAKGKSIKFVFRKF